MLIATKWTGAIENVYYNSPNFTITDQKPEEEVIQTSHAVPR
jgi:hypothetical protein